jgi:hypothetical protein
MKTPLLLGLLALSLGLNAWLFSRSSRPGSPHAGHSAEVSASPAAATPAGVAPGPARPAAGPRPVMWTDPDTSVAGLRALAADLRAAGMPPDVYVRIIGSLLRERTHADLAALPFWKLLGRSAEARRTESAAGLELLRLQEEILGPEGTRTATLDPLERRRRYGSLPDDKIEKLLRIERDYAELNEDESSSFRVGSVALEEFEAHGGRRTALEKERLADVRAAVSPAEFAEWEFRNSAAAQRVQSALRGMTLTEPEYHALYAAQTAFEPEVGTAMIQLPNADPRIAERSAMHDKIRATLGEERLDRYLINSDATYGGTSSFVDRQTGMARTHVYPLYQLQLEASDLRRRSAVTPGGAAVADPRAAWAELNTRLESLLGPERAAAYRQSGLGGLFNSYRPAPAAAGATVPAVRLPGAPGPNG